MTHKQVINDAAQKILSFVDLIIIVTDEAGIILEANRSACELFCYSAEELTGMPVHLLLPPRYRERHVDALRQFVSGGETQRRMGQRDSVIGYRKDGALIELDAGIAKFHSGDQWILVVSMLDITQRKHQVQELIRQSTHDALTGLPNRKLIHERLNNALQRSLRNKLNVALLFIDLDGFKLINDNYGHITGDEVLKIIADRLLAQIRPDDTVGRLSGDEFIVLCEQIEKPELIANLATRINDALKENITCLDLNLSVTASIGIIIGHGQQYSADEMMRLADTAMYEMKQKGRGGWQFFNDQLQKKAHQKNSIGQGLRRALEHNELSAVYQPIITPDTEQIVGAELLLRWNLNGKSISPEIFIPVAEMTGMVFSIGDWVFREGCKVQADWQRRWNDQAPYVSINLSARQLNHKQLLNNFAAILQETGANPAKIVIELTEAALMPDIESNLTIFHQLSDLGLQIAIDDFGTGYSSLSQLIQLPISLLKISKSFVDDLESQQEKQVLIRTIIGMGHSLGLKLIVGGIETEVQLAELKQYGCDFIQGYFFYLPMPEQDFIRAMNHQASQWDKNLTV
ncbi:putative bifunctional diguanylate cyclase/phosphodiesterase [Nitrosomonas oligotropha]|uniref:putative bifunctional diguanylate cyclase/phosphodiesterase n=1 Tax=Nitrosomonas oligotropha TaxID=42354 RepID=UPI00136F946E|nr:EAL domain-containing protein [Nitrosomonas oligotropha]MXS83029.1 EAL domain-containing protein [Nitrosomonas oligotropha]